MANLEITPVGADPLIALTRNPQPLFRAWAAYLEGIAVDAFDQRKSPDGAAWAGLSPATIALKRASGSNFADTPLKDSGQLYDSLAAQVLTDGVRIGTNRTVGRYSLGAIQQFGARIPITPKMRKYFWAKYYEARGAQSARSGDGKRNTKKKKQQVAELGEKANLYKAMALTKKNFFDIPPRPFLPVTLSGEVYPEVQRELTNLARLYFSSI